MRKHHKQLLETYFKEEFNKELEIEEDGRIYLATTTDDDGLHIDVALDYEEESLLFLDAFSSRVIAAEQIENMDLFFRELRFDWVIGRVRRYIEGV